MKQEELFDALSVVAVALVCTLIGMTCVAIYYRAEINRRWPDDATRANCSGDAHWVCMANKSDRMLKLPCAKSLRESRTCSYIVFDTAWGQVEDVVLGEVQ